MAVSGVNAMGPVRHAETSVLSVGYCDLGTGPAVVLLHGFPYDVHAYADVAPMLAEAGLRVIVPYLRGMAPPGSATLRFPAPRNRPRSPATSSNCWTALNCRRRCWPASTGAPGPPSPPRRCGPGAAPASCPLAATSST